jgi:hypothetical protein
MTGGSCRLLSTEFKGNLRPGRKFPRGGFGTRLVDRFSDRSTRPVEGAEKVMISGSTLPRGYLRVWTTFVASDQTWSMGFGVTAISVPHIWHRVRLAALEVTGGGQTVRYYQKTGKPPDHPKADHTSRERRHRLRCPDTPVHDAPRHHTARRVGETAFASPSWSIAASLLAARAPTRRI